MRNRIMEILKTRHVRQGRWVLTCGVILASMGWFAGCARPQHLAEERGRNLAVDMQALQQAADEFEGMPPLTLESAVAFALEHNLRATAARLEHEIELERATGERLKMLPSLTIESDIKRKTHPNATTSTSVVTGKRSEDATFSEEKIQRSWNVSAAWNLLDFGLSYVRSQRAGDEARMRRQQLRRVRQNLEFDVTRAYWRAVISETAFEKAQEILFNVEQRQETVERQIAEKSRAEPEGLAYKRTLLQIRMRLETLRQHAARSKANLAQLLGLPPGTPLRLAEVAFESVPSLPEAGLAALENEALHSRPEMFEEDLKGRVAMHEARMELLRMFPSIDLFGRRDFEDSKYLKWENWYAVGMNSAWRLLSMPQQYRAYKTAEKGTDLARQRRVAMTVAIMTQVRLALFAFEDAERQLTLARDMWQVQSRLHEIMKLRMDRGEVNEETVFEAQAEALFAYIQYMDAHAEAVVARKRVENAVGRSGRPELPPAPAPIPAPMARTPVPEKRQTTPRAEKASLTGIEKLMREAEEALAKAKTFDDIPARESRNEYENDVPESAAPAEEVQRQPSTPESVPLEPIDLPGRDSRQQMYGKAPKKEGRSGLVSHMPLGNAIRLTDIRPDSGGTRACPAVLMPKMRRSEARKRLPHYERW